MRVCGRMHARKCTPRSSWNSTTVLKVGYERRYSAIRAITDPLFLLDFRSVRSREVGDSVARSFHIRRSFLFNNKPIALV